MMRLNKHVLNKIIQHVRTQSLLCVIDRTTQSSGRGIHVKGGCPKRLKAL